ncbi:Thyroglobulin type-1 domain and EF-hand domain and Kazal domain and EF-hand domain pair and SPARC/Testican, calcium-binding domain-containing protein [Strongyloides ratti]|uniref:Thyroglobulin type-1 domain and EF-hand domain and Kazal domain and EF-hand domain pair and SPARC/Testican, calcium-binding domain-containing protein n=1 Tax=Strongyloides ratti TaxID=34506 RepID=A0A090LRN4_STRRB|nr:Thyroglobulin type-1 domain and EF-hand domain and Kazal domain and EF-hand domain pair and SPARC/Testican, calcium-binding domain-containing protein [Strongyloides ratti]CEF70221.1 Thyroglobulin type-1 domain and EF-hand domain and Kazal domain and EF-hand domain pair and SPARC/Testican, calcium-binding domain-containing protein [Strongyloides ratti]
MIYLLLFLSFVFIFGKKEICKSDVLCDKDNDFKIQKPFCGSDGRSYKNICQLKISICKERNVIKLFDGYCFSNSTCYEEKEKRKLYNKNLELFHHESAPYIPKCDNNTGNYQEIQCQYNNQYCWCVKKNGIIIPYTAIIGNKPICKKRKVIHISHHKKKNKNITINIHNCASYFTTNKNLSQKSSEEWLKTKDDVIKKENQSFVTNIGFQTTDELTNCKYQRTLILNRTLLSKLSSTYIPICQKLNENFYEEIQCHPTSKICWCVDIINGYPLHGTSVINKLPSCSNKTSTIKVRDVISRFQIKKCPKKKRIHFYRSFFIKITNDMISKLNSTTDIENIGKNFDKESRIKIMLWKFKELDKDKDGDLSEKELVILKKNLKNIRNIKSCVKNFKEFCDSDGDKVISKNEWIYCTVEGSLSSSLLSIGKKPHANPFLHILKPE